MESWKVTLAHCNFKFKKVFCQIIKNNVVATIGSVKKIPDLTKYKMLIIDECHRASASQFQEFLDKTSYPLRYGFSATPEGNDKYNFAKIINQN